MSLVVSVAISIGDGDSTWVQNMEGETVLSPNADDDEGYVALASLCLDRLVERTHTKTSEQLSQLRERME